MPYTEDLSWNLDNLFPGGVSGQAFRDAIARVEARAAQLCDQADALGSPSEDDAWDTVIPGLIEVETQAADLLSMTMCASAAHARDVQAQRADARAQAVWSVLDRAWTRPDDIVARCSDAEFEALCARPALADVVPLFRDRRQMGHLLLPTDEQSLFAELADDALHAWGRRYNRLAGALEIPVDGERISPAQAHNRLSDPDPLVRRATFAGMQQAWGEAADDCADLLTHIYGVRGTLYRRLAVDELAEPLARCRIRRATLNALLSTCHTLRPVLWRYLAAKARLLGRDRLDWQDLRAPVGHLSSRHSYGEAQELIVREFGNFSQSMADFAREAFTKQWVEAEDRADKRHGAFCTTFPSFGESRIFMTYAGGIDNVLTLAHELGHGFHYHAMRHLPRPRQRVPSTLAETASTFGEALVRGAALAAANDDAERLALLDQELADATTFLINIPIRFEFERSLHALRAEGPLKPAVLSARMEALQREWYGPVLGRLHPTFWAEKLHFYLTSQPFYNFPYIFGYLFSGLVYSRAMSEGPAWAPCYEALLRDTGAGPAEPIAATHLGVDLEAPSSWAPSVARIVELVERYEALAGA